MLGSATSLNVSIPPTRSFGECHVGEAVSGHRRIDRSFSTKDRDAAGLDRVISAGLIAPFLPCLLPHAGHDHSDNSTREHADTISTITRPRDRANNPPTKMDQQQS